MQCVLRGMNEILYIVWINFTVREFYIGNKMKKNEITPHTLYRELMLYRLKTRLFSNLQSMDIPTYLRQGTLCQILLYILLSVILNITLSNPSMSRLSIGIPTNMP